MSLLSNDVGTMEAPGRLTEAPVEEKSGERAPEIPSIDAYFDQTSQRFLVEDQSNRWISINATMMKKWLQKNGLSGRPEVPGTLSPADDYLSAIPFERSVDYAGPLAGQASGYYEENGVRCLITDSPKIIEPSEGDWPILLELLWNLFCEADGIDQRPYVYGWIKCGYEALRSGSKRPGQVICLAGDAGCGKSLFQLLLTEIFGGRSARPYQYMSGATPFNLNLAQAEHLMIEDEAPSTDMRKRREFGAHIKEMTVNKNQNLHGKGKNQMCLSLFHRVSVSTNTEPQNLMVLPPLDDSITDKLMLLKIHSRPMPMPTTTDEEKELFWNTLLGELPGFLAYLETYQLPSELQSPRFGVIHYHHPELLRAINELSDEAHFLAIIDREIFGRGRIDYWKGRAEQLERELRDTSSWPEISRLLRGQHACGRLLGVLKKQESDRISQDRTNQGGREWMIKAPNGPR
jgi:hypothetical protein